MEDGEVAVAAPHVVPVAGPDPLVGPGVRGAAPGAVVLEAAAHVVGFAVVDADLVELRERQVRQLAPVVGAVPADRDAAIATEDEVVGVRRVDPERVVVGVDLGGRVRREVVPPVRGAVQTRTAQVKPLRIVRVDADLAVVHGTVVRGARLHPRLAAVGRLPGARLAVGVFLGTEALSRGARVGFDDRPDEVPVPAVDVEPDATHVTLRQAAGELRPVVAAVHRPVDTATRTAAVETPQRPLPLVHGREQRHRIARIHGEVDRARVLVDVEDEFPRLTPVHRPVHAALGVGAPQATHGRHVGHVRIPGMDLDAGDVVRRLEPEVRPGPAGIRRPEHAHPPRRGLAVLRFARADPHDVRVRRGEGDVPDGEHRLVVEERFERASTVDRLPHATRRHANVEGGRIGLVDRDVGDAAAHDRGADFAPFERLDGRLQIGVLGQRGKGGCGDGKHREERQRHREP